MSSSSPTGALLDFSIAGIETDCKFSQDAYAWMIPVEAVRHVCLGVTANDAHGSWSAGIFRANDSLLGAPNRDRKRRLTAEGHESVEWLFTDAHLPPNVLLQIPPQVAAEILGLTSGQQRTNELFRLVRSRVESTHATIATVARQHDYMKRVRYNGGGPRSHLRSEGIVILGHSEATPGLRKA